MKSFWYWGDWDSWYFLPTIEFRSQSGGIGGPSTYYTMALAWLKLRAGIEWSRP